MFKGKKLSSNLPYKVHFMLPGDGKDVKVIAHLVRRPLSSHKRLLKDVWYIVACCACIAGM